MPTTACTGSPMRSTSRTVPASWPPASRPTPRSARSGPTTHTNCPSRRPARPSRPSTPSSGASRRSTPTMCGAPSVSSRASPHTAGTVALMWSAAPSLIGNVDATRAILDDSATDTPDAQCGGTADDNNVWGEGKLNAFAAVDLSPRGPTGTLTGTVTSAASGKPIAGALVQVTGPSNRTLLTGAD